jgi:drug/metabolite transporter (DMT)-like permease
MGASALLLAPAALATLPSSAPALGPVAAMAGLGIAGTGIAFVIFYSLIASVGPAKAMLVSYIAPGFAVVYGAVFLSEGITAGKIIGLSLILAGSWLGAGGAQPVAAQPSAEASAAAFARSEAATR